MLEKILKNAVCALLVSATPVLFADSPVPPASISEQTAAPLTIFIDKEPTEKKVEMVRRVVFDINGSAIRVLAADVEIGTNKIEKLFNAKIEVGFRKDLMKNMEKKEFSEEIQMAAHDAILQLQELVSKYQPDQYTGIVVDSFLMASNGKEMINHLSEISGPIAVVSQQDKGVLEFLSGVANSDADAENTVVVDMCSLNAHITALNEDGTFITYGEKLGFGIINDFIAKNIRKLEKTPEDINPVTEDEALQVIDYLKHRLNEMPESLKEKLRSKTTSLIATFAPIAGEKEWKKSNGWKFLQKNILERVSEDPSSPLLTSKALFIYTLVEKMNIKKCKLTGTDALEGSASGVMISESYWPKT